MDSITITSRIPISLEQIGKSLSHCWKTSLVEDGQKVVIEGESQRIYIYRPTITTGAGPREEVFVDYSGVEFVKQVIPLIADSPEVIVDNDFGTVWFGDLFVAYLKAHPEWNWRDEDP